MVIIWGAGFLFLFCRYIYANLNYFRFIRLHSSIITDIDPYASVLRQIYGTTHCRKKIHLMKSSFSKEPCVFYFRDYYIILPDHLQLNTEELYSILSHEIFHIIHHDLLIKNLVHLTCMLYWWNPFGGVFQKQIDLLLELQADQKAGGKTAEDKIRYLSCLLKVARQTSEQKHNKLAGLFFTTESGSLLEKRLQVLINDNPKKSAHKFQPILLPVCILILCSFFIIFEPNYISPEYEEGTFELTADNSYAVQQEDGSFDIYYLDEYLENTDTLEYYPENMIIYYNNEGK